MRLAFLADMHGNLPAFEAVLAEIDRRGPFDGIYAGGDIVMRGVYPAECVQLLIDRDLKSVRGNHEEFVVHLATGGAWPKFDWPPNIQQDDVLRDMGTWTVARLEREQSEYLRDLPLSLTFTGPSGQTLMLTHATPWSTQISIRHDDPEHVKREALDRSGADMLMYGHIHHAYQQDIDDRTICCLGAVGLTYDGDTRACFAIVTDDGAGWRCEHVRVAYDHEAYARLLDEADAPGTDMVARIVRTARRASPWIKVG